MQRQRRHPVAGQRAVAGPGLLAQKRDHLDVAEVGHKGVGAQNRVVPVGRRAARHKRLRRRHTQPRVELVDLAERGRTSSASLRQNRFCAHWPLVAPLASIPPSSRPTSSASVATSASLLGCGLAVVAHGLSSQEHLFLVGLLLGAGQFLFRSPPSRFPCAQLRQSGFAFWRSYGS